MTIRYETAEAVATITIDRPEALNAFDIPDLEQLREQLRRAARDDSVRVVILTGVGRAFSVGADIKAMDRMGEADFAKAAGLYQSLALEARNLDKPIIGAINGYALGGGLEVALMCDLRIAARSAQLRLPDAEMGFSPTGGLTYLLVRMVGLTQSLDMALGAEMLDAEKAERIGLVSRVVDDQDLMAHARDLALRMTGYPQVGLRNIKRAFYAAAESNFAATLALEKAYDSDCYRSPETRQKLAEFVESRRKK